MKWKEKNDLKSDTIHASLNIFMEQMLQFFFMIIILCRESFGEVRPQTVFVRYTFRSRKKLIRFAELLTFVLGQTPKCIHSTFISRSLIFQLQHMRESRKGVGAENKIHKIPTAKLSKKNIHWNHPILGKHIHPSYPRGKKLWTRACCTSQYMYHIFKISRGRS